MLALKAAGVAALALGYHAWRLLSKREDDPDRQQVSSRKVPLLDSHDLALSEADLRSARTSSASPPPSPATDRAPALDAVASPRQASQPVGDEQASAASSRDCTRSPATVSAASSFAACRGLRELLPAAGGQPASSPLASPASVPVPAGPGESRSPSEAAPDSPPARSAASGVGKPGSGQPRLPAAVHTGAAARAEVRERESVEAPTSEQPSGEPANRQPGPPAAAVGARPSSPRTPPSSPSPPAWLGKPPLSPSSRHPFGLAPHASPPPATSPPLSARALPPAGFPSPSAPAASNLPPAQSGSPDLPSQPASASPARALLHSPTQRSRRTDSIAQAAEAAVDAAAAPPASSPATAPPLPAPIDVPRPASPLLSPAHHDSNGNGCLAPSPPSAAPSPPRAEEGSSGSSSSETRAWLAASSDSSPAPSAASRSSPPEADSALSFPEVDYQPLALPPFGPAPAPAGLPSRGGAGPAEPPHRRLPSFPDVDYEPQAGAAGGGLLLGNGSAWLGAPAAAPAAALAASFPVAQPASPTHSALTLNLQASRRSMDSALPSIATQANGRRLLLPQRTTAAAQLHSALDALAEDSPVALARSSMAAEEPEELTPRAEAVAPSSFFKSASSPSLRNLLHTYSGRGVTGTMDSSAAARLRGGERSRSYQPGPVAAAGEDSSGGGGRATQAARAARTPHPATAAARLGAKRAREAGFVPLALKLDILAGPCMDHSFTTDHQITEVTVGRLEDNMVVLRDNEVSGLHAVMRWDAREKCWQVTDVGSLNGTLLNGMTISTNTRQRGREYRLNSDDILQLGSYSKIKVSYLPTELLASQLPGKPKKLHTPPSPINPRLQTAGGPDPAPQAVVTPKTPAPQAGEPVRCARLRLEAAVVSTIGREHLRRGGGCEDVPFWECPLRASPDAALFAVFDGHCGRSAADEARVLLPEHLSQRLPGKREAMLRGEGAGDAWEEAFLATDAAIKSEQGCTATALLAWRDGEGATCLQAANVGDSAAFLFPLPSGPLQPLTADHRLTNPVERARLAAQGIQLAEGRTRLYGLNLSRCLGDKFLKDEDLGLSAHPHVSPPARLPPGCAALVLLASDGLWDVADGEHALQVALRAQAEAGGSLSTMAEAVVSHAQKQRTKDDVTVVLVKISSAVEVAATSVSVGSY